MEVRFGTVLQAWSPAMPIWWAREKWSQTLVVMLLSWFIAWLVLMFFQSKTFVLIFQVSMRNVTINKEHSPFGPGLAYQNPQACGGPAHFQWLLSNAWATAAEMPFTPSTWLYCASSFYQHHHISHRVPMWTLARGHMDVGRGATAKQTARGRWCVGGDMSWQQKDKEVSRSGQVWHAFVPLLGTETPFLSPAMTFEHVTFTRESHNCIN